MSEAERLSFFPAAVSRIADARFLAFAMSEARGIAKDLSTCEKRSRALAYICIVPKSPAK
jgi:hypothetical protein